MPAGNETGQWELDGLATVPRGIEFLVGLVFSADVVDLHYATRLGFSAIAYDDVLDDKVGRRRARLGFNNRFIHGDYSPWEI